MSDMTLNQVLGPRYEIVIQQEQVNVADNYQLTLQRNEPLRINVGDGFNGAATASSGTVDVTIVAQEIINAFRAVGHDGYFVQPTLESLSGYAGVSRFAAVIGDPVDVVRAGKLEDSGFTWTPNQPIFVAVNGVLTQTIPSDPSVTGVRRIGWAISATEINLDPFPIVGV